MALCSKAPTYGSSKRSQHIAVSHRFPSGNQTRNHCHRKTIFWLVLGVFLWLWVSFELVWLVLLPLTFVDSNRRETAVSLWFGIQGAAVRAAGRSKKVSVGVGPYEVLKAIFLNWTPDT